VFDTQVAAGFAGFGAQTGYGSLLNDVLGLRLAKSASFTRWDDRPLSPEQLAYARDDVAHLLRLADALQERLRATGRLQWAREECRRLEEASDERDPWLAWQRLPRIGQLNPRARAVARELAAWREQTAAAEDRPVAQVLGDAPLMEVAKRRPAAASALERIRGLQPSTLRRRSEAILAAVARGLAADPLPVEVVERPDSNPADVPAIALSEALVRALTPAWPTSWWRPATTWPRWWPRSAGASPSRRSAPSRAGAATWSGASCWSCWAAAAPCRSTATVASRSAAADRRGRPGPGDRPGPGHQRDRAVGGRRQPGP
jgi:hypothetical protein